MRKDAKFWNTIADKDVQCLLCAHNCIIKDDKRGICGVRKNDGGRLYTLIYGSYSSMAVDPIEKKPFFHFCPGTDVLSLVLLVVIFGAITVKTLAYLLLVLKTFIYRRFYQKKQWN